MTTTLRVLAVAWLLACPGGVLGGEWPVPKGPSNAPVCFRYAAEAVQKLPREFLEDTPACYLFSGVFYRVEDDGTIDRTTHEVIRFNGRKGIERLGEYRAISYDPGYQSLTLHLARIHKADGKIVDVEPKHVHLRDLGTDFLVYDPDKQLVISFPNLEVGDVIEVQWTVRGKNPEHHGEFFTRYTFGDDVYPIALDELRIRLPKGKRLHHATVGGKEEPTVQEEGGTKTYVWRVVNRPQLPQDEALPSREELRLQVMVSTFATWDDVARWKAKLREHCWNCTPEIQRVVEEVTKDLATPREKARALTYWVRRNIRYVSAGSSHDYTPHSPDKVLANRYGDCKDQSQLLAVMLKHAGIPVSLATLGSRGDGQILDNVPSPWGTHAILLVELDGNQHWIDTTISLGGWDFLPRDDRGRLCYVTNDAGLRLLRTPTLTADGNRVEQTSWLSVAADGSSRCRRRSVFHGAAAYVQREEWVEVPLGERRRLTTSELQGSQSKARLCRLHVDEYRLHDLDGSVSAELEFEVPNHFAGGDLEREGSVTDSQLWNRLLSYNVDYDRTMPMELWSPFELKHRFVVTLPPALVFDGLPRDRRAVSKWGSFSLTARADPADPRRMELLYHSRLEQTRIEPADFDAFRKFHDEVLRGYRVWMTLKPTTDLDDVPALEAMLALAPGDAASAAVLARLYLRHGQADQARRVLARARRYSPDSASLLELSIEAAKTLDDELVFYRELIRRFPDELRHAVHYGETLAALGRHKEARDVLLPLTRTGTDSLRALALYYLARSALAQDQPGNALRYFEEAEAVSAETTGTAAGWKFKAQVLARLKLDAQAAQAYRKALDQAPEDLEALTALMRLERAAGRDAAAVDLVRRYTLAVGNDLKGLVRAAEFHLELGRLDDAFDLAWRSRDVGFSSDAQRVLGLVHYRRGDLAKALFHLERGPADSDTLEALIHCNLALGKLRRAEDLVLQVEILARPSEQAKRAAAQVVALTQRRVLVRKAVPEDKQDAWRPAIDQFVCAEYAYEKGHPLERVQTLLEGAFAHGAKIGPAHGLRGWLALERGQLALALEHAELAVQLSPDDLRGWLTRGRARLERDQLPNALADLAHAVESSGRKNAAALHWLAAALFRAGKTDDALATQRLAVQIDPNNRDCVEQLKRFEQRK